MKPQKCPVCNGKGHLLEKGVSKKETPAEEEKFELNRDWEEDTESIEEVKCHGCEGKGWVVIMTPSEVRPPVPSIPIPQPRPEIPSPQDIRPYPFPTEPIYPDPYIGDGYAKPRWHRITTPTYWVGMNRTSRTDDSCRLTSSY